METKAVRYYNLDYNCSQCILKAFGEKYLINIEDQTISGCSVFNNGLGIGGFCGAVASAIIIFGLLSDELPAKKMRICFLSKFREKYPDFNCGRLKREDNNCLELIGFSAKLIDEIIHQEKLLIGSMDVL